MVCQKPVMRRPRLMLRETPRPADVCGPRETIPIDRFLQEEIQDEREAYGFL